MLDHQFHNRLLELLVFVNDYDGLGIVGYLFVHHRCSIGGILDVAEELLDFSFHLVHVHVADNDDTLI